MGSYAIGLDFGTESVRALLVDVANGETIATAVEPYADGVIDERLPGATGTSERLPPDWALQNPADWITGLERTIRTVVGGGRINPADVIGIGIDFTSCTVLPTNAAGVPLCRARRARQRATCLAQALEAPRGRAGSRARDVRRRIEEGALAPAIRRPHLV